MVGCWRRHQEITERRVFVCVYALIDYSLECTRHTHACTMTLCSLTWTKHIGTEYSSVQFRIAKDACTPHSDINTDATLKKCRWCRCRFTLAFRCGSAIHVGRYSPLRGTQQRERLHTHTHGYYTHTTRAQAYASLQPSVHALHFNCPAL